MFIRIAGSCIPGRSHIAHNRSCEDAWAYSGSLQKNHCRAVVVCDGAGSKPRSKVGAKITSQLMAKWLVEHFDYLLRCQESIDDLKQQIVKTIQDAINQQISLEKSNESIMDYACTFLAVAMDKNKRWFACHIGDGGIIGKNLDEIFIVSEPSKGEFANVTFFITESDAVEHLNVCVNSRPVYSFALFSDGLEKSLIQSQTNMVAPVMGRILDWLLSNSEEDVSQAIEKNLREVFAQRTTDDCTLAIITYGTKSRIVLRRGKKRRLKRMKR